MDKKLVFAPVCRIAFGSLSRVKVLKFSRNQLKSEKHHFVVPFRKGDVKLPLENGQVRHFPTIIGSA